MTRKKIWPPRPPLTHFLCLPLINPASRPTLENSLKTFRDNVSSSQQLDDVHSHEDATENPTVTDSPTRLPPTAIRPVGTLHCTLGVMSLKGERLTEAINILQSINVKSILSEVTRSNEIDISGDNIEKEGAEHTDTSSTPGKAKQAIDPIVISMKGLQSMHDPTQTSVLYSPPEDSSGRLYAFCTAVRKRFLDADLLEERDRELILHATVINTVYTKPRGRSKQTSRGLYPKKYPRPKTPHSFDARNLMAEYKDYNWADKIVLDRLAIFEMGAKKILDEDGITVIDEIYDEIAAIALPQ